MKKIIAFLLSCVMLFGLLNVFGFAADQPRYLVLGDSIAYGSGLANPKEAVYGKIVADTEGYAYENYAVPGHTTGNLLRRMENEAVKACSTTASSERTIPALTRSPTGSMPILKRSWATSGR